MAPAHYNVSYCRIMCILDLEITSFIGRVYCALKSMSPIPRQASLGKGGATSPGRTIALQSITILTYVLLQCLATLVVFTEILSAKVFEILSSFLAIPPCGIYEPKESAIVVVGGDDDVGREIALSFSELGYTVFALCRTKHDEVHPEAPPETSNISSLLYEWHNKRKKCEHSPWGLVAPIVLDTGSASQRAHAFETVHAYCAAHALHLVSLIVSPPCAPLYPWELAPPRNPRTSRKHDAGKPSDNTRASIALWGDVVNRCITEPILVVQDCVNMLAAASGRVVVMIGSGYEPASMLEGAHQSVALQLSQELDPLGIKVSSVLCGPSTTNFNRPQEFSLSDASQSRIESVSSTAASARTEHIRSIRNAIEEALRYFPVHSEDVTHVLREITKSSYPKYKYIIGIHPFLHLVQNATPTVLRLCVTSLRHHLS